MLATRTWVCGANRFAGVDVGEPGGVAGEGSPVADDREAAGEIVGDHDSGQRVVDGGGLGGCGRGGEPEDQEGTPDDCGAHYGERSSQE